MKLILRIKTWFAKREAQKRIATPWLYYSTNQFGETVKDAYSTASPIVQYYMRQLSASR